MSSISDAEKPWRVDMREKSLRIRRFIAKYIGYVQIFSWAFVAFIATGVCVLWFVKVDDTAGSQEASEIRPHEELVTRAADAVVLRVLVPNHTDVAAGQALVEVSDDPVWIARRRSTMPRAPEEWERVRDMTTGVKLYAPIAGVVDVPGDLEGRIIPAGREIARVVDFNVLTISVKLKGPNHIYASEGQKVEMELLTPYDNEVLRGAIDYPGWWWNGHARFHAVGEGKIRDALQAYLTGKAVGLEDEEDYTFVVSNVTDVDIQGVLRVEEARDETMGEGVTAEPLVGVTLSGTVQEATHTVSAKYRDLPDFLRQEIQQTILERFQAGVRVDDSALSLVDTLRSEAEWPGLFRDGLRMDDSALSVARLDGLKVAVTIDAERTGMTDPDGRRPREVEKVERNCSVVVKLDDPPENLRARVREMALREPPSYYSATLKVVTGERRIAMLLFRKN